MKQFYSLCMIMLLASVLAIDVMGQKTTLTVTGKVTDLEGDPLSGVSVVVQGTTRGTITNIDGAYSINVPSKQSVLVFSMISMKTVDHRVGNSTQINIIMEEDVIGLGDVEVVAIGYGSMRRSDLTGSISSISKDALSERAITSLEDAMRGKAAGMQIVQNDGAPGSDYTIRIRGASSVNASSAPIFVIDGVICEDASSLNPGDVASIEILKDASSTAIYGSRGANGVIMITTRQGTNDGKTRVELYANLGMQQAEFSSWLLEIVKPAYGQPVNGFVYDMVLSSFERLLELLHPFMPFITEELWQQLREREPGESLMVTQLFEPVGANEQFLADFEVAKEIISNVRSIRLQKNIALKEELELQVVGTHPVEKLNPVIIKMCNLSSVTVVESKSEGAASFMIGTTEFAVPLGNMIDVEAEIARMEAELKHKEGFLQGVMKKLSNEKFVNNAPAAVLELERKKQADAESIINSLKESIAALKKS